MVRNRDQALLNLSLTHKASSDLFLSCLNRDIRTSILNGESFLPRLFDSPHYFERTHSLRLDNIVTERENYSEALGDRFQEVVLKINHPDLSPLQAE